MLIARLIRLFILLLTIVNFNISAMNNVIPIETSDGDIYFDLLDGVELEDIKNEEALFFRGGGGLAPIVVDYLTLSEPFKDISKPLWQRTAAPHGRDMLYHLPHKIATIEYGGAAASLFFNMTDKMNVTAQSLLDFEAVDTSKLNDLISLVGLNISNDDFSSLIPLFKKIRIQERKSGSLFQYGFTRGPWNIQLHSSLQISARNFFISKKDQQAIEAIFPNRQVEDKEFYIISYGAGDTRLKIGLNTVNATNLKLDVGVETIFPTSRFSSQPNPQPFTFDANQIETLQENGVTFLRGLRDFMLTSQLGNGGYFGFGNYAESKIDIFNELASLRFRVSYDKLFPADTVRLFMYKQTRASIADFAYVGGGPSEEELLNQIIQQFVLPTPFRVHVHPGSIFNAIVSISTQTKHWDFALGYDFYAQQRERITQIYNTTITLQDLDIEGAERIAAFQHKIFSEATYRKKYKNSEFGVGLGGDVTVLSRGLGYDWTTYLKIFTSF